MSPLITAAALRDLLASPTPPRVLDVRWRLDQPDGRADFAAGHIPGAVYVDLDQELAEHGAPSDGRHPLPSTERLQASARGWGLNDGDTVVVYDDLTNMSAARAWWMLRDAGVADVRVLDGAYRAWLADGFAVETGPTLPLLGSITLDAGHLTRLSIAEVADAPQRGVLLDARAGERFRGEVEPIDPRAGHIPGAVSAPTAANVDEDGRFLAPDVLRARFAALGVTDSAPVAAYCGSGVTASHEILALTIAGFDAALYAGSWSQWSNHPELPVATGG